MAIRFLAAAAVGAVCLAAALAPPQPGPVIQTEYHLTARPWRPLATPPAEYLDTIEGLCRFTARHQDPTGAIIDPFLKREHQYATPYFAYAVGTLIAAGRARDLLPAGVQAMEHATTNFAGGVDQIPNRHGEFFIAALTESLDVYSSLVPPETLARWRERLRKPLRQVIAGVLNNWETYAMKGEWLRANAGLADRAAAVAAIETAWNARQRPRFAPAPWSLYHDRSSVPDTLSVEAVGRGNLLALVDAGYDGPSAAEMRRDVEAGSLFTLYLQDPSGQVPANGRTDDHVWVEAGYQLCFEVMARRALRAGDAWRAGQFRHGAELAFHSLQRWRRSDGEWAGSFFVTKNRFDPALRVGYQLASEYSNYNGSLMFHLAEAFHAHRGTATEQPAPAEIGGYAIELDPEYASAFANAGGMQIQANLRGQAAATHGQRWTPLGIVRFARAGWDTRLGPSDGALTENGGVSFAPEFFENGRWLRLADLSTRYQGVWSVAFVHPLLVRCAVDYRPLPGQSGPTFRNEFVLTPDGALSTVMQTSPGAAKWAVTWPLLENDGRPLRLTSGDGIRGVQSPDGADRQNFLALGSDQISEEPLLRSTYGDLRPLRVEPAGARQQTFVYPQGPGDPPAPRVRQSLHLTSDGWKSALGWVGGTLYAGRTSAGGYGQTIDLDGDGRADASFTQPCGFLLQLDSGRVTAVEADQDVEAQIQGRRVRLTRHQPLRLR